MALPVGQSLHLPRRGDGTLWTPDRGADAYNLYGTDAQSRGLIPFPVSWPAAPVTTSTYSVPGQISASEAMSIANAEFNVSAGSHGAFAPRANNQRWNLADDATFSGFNCSHDPIYSSIEVNGGRFVGSSGNYIILNNLLMRNCVIQSTSGGNSIGIGAFGANPTRFVQRNAFVHCTIDAYATGLITPGKSPGDDAGHNDIIFAASIIRGGQFGAPLPSEAGLRLMGINRAVIVDCRLASGFAPSTYKNTLRSHYGCVDYWARNNLSEYGDGIFIRASGGTGTPMQMGNHWIYDFQHYKGSDNPNSAGANIYRDYDAAYWTNGSLTVAGCRAYDHRQTNPSGESSRYFLNAVAGDAISDNLEFPYQNPPAIGVWLAADGQPPGADH